MNGVENALGPRAAAAPAVRIVHLGLGAFHRSHQAWYTARASDAAEWGIAAYTGRSAALAEALTAQDGRFTLIARSTASDDAEVIDSIVRAHAGTDMASFVKDIAAAETAIVTLTITEAAYADPLAPSDAALISVGGASAAPNVRTALGRLVVGLEARRRAGNGAIALVSCDNLPDNGGVLRRAIQDLAAGIPELRDWLDHHASFVSTSVDRITPRIDHAELEILQARYSDSVPVVTEPFSDWVLSGDFPAGRPDWEAAGARFTAELEPWELRKLWLLNGAHTLLAALGRLRGHRSVSEAIKDPECRQAVDELWDEAVRHLPTHLDVEAYRGALIDRFENPRIVHSLEQIAIDSDTKLRHRIVPVAIRERRAGRSARGCASAIAAWLSVGEKSEAQLSTIESIRGLSEPLADDDGFVEEVLSARERLTGIVPA